MYRTVSHPGYKDTAGVASASPKLNARTDARRAASRSPENDRKGSPWSPAAARSASEMASEGSLCVHAEAAVRPWLPAFTETKRNLRAAVCLVPTQRAASSLGGKEVGGTRRLARCHEGELQRQKYDDNSCAASPFSC